LQGLTSSRGGQMDCENRETLRRVSVPGPHLAEQGDQGPGGPYWQAACTGAHISAYERTVAPTLNDESLSWM
jgi:hypothetical protein